MNPGYKYQTQPSQPQPIVLYVDLDGGPFPNASVVSVTYVVDSEGAEYTFNTYNPAVLTYGNRSHLKFEVYGPSSLTLTEPKFGGRFVITWKTDTSAQSASNSMECVLYP